MRRWSSDRAGWKVDFAQRVREQIRALPEETRESLHSRLGELAELAQLAPIMAVGSFAADSAPPLHLTVDDCVVTYVLDRQGRLVRVVGLDTL